MTTGPSGSAGIGLTARGEGFGGRWARARCGRWPLWWLVYSVSTARRWRSPAMSIWSVHARRTVPTQRSATGVGPRRLGRDADDLDADGGEHRVEGGTELAVPVAQ